MTRAPETDGCVEPATARDVPTVAALHRACLPDSMISMLGPAAVTRYYDLVTTSASEHVFVARSQEDRSRQDAKIAKPRLDQRRDEGTPVAEHESDPSTSAWRSRRLGGSPSGEVVAACVLTLEPHTVMARFARLAPLRLVADLVAKTLHAGFRRRMRARVGERQGGTGPGVPEVTQIFTDAAQRGKGLGSALLRACEDRLRDLGHLTYCIHTLRDDNDAGVRFYRREGFTETGTSRSFGDHYLVMTKALT